MKRPRAHQIDEEARRILLASLTSEWVVTPYQDDYGKDYLVEVYENEKPTGEMFHIQLKGKARPEPLSSKNVYSFSLAKKYLVYYLESVREPVFLVLADVKRSRAVYLFLQRYVIDTYGDVQAIKKSKKKEFALHIPLINDPTDSVALLRHAREAIAYMVDRYPGSVGAAVRQRKRGLKELDPRFEYEVNVNNGKEQIQLKAVEPVDFKLQVSGEKQQVEKQIHDLIGKGLPVQLTPGSFKFEGSPLFDEFNREGGTLEWCLHVPACLSTSLLMKDGDICCRLPDFHGQFSGGLKEMRFEGRLEKCPFEFDVTIVGALDAKGANRVTTTWRVLLSKWQGLPIRELPFFTITKSFAGAISTAQGFNLKLDALGNQIVDRTVPIQKEMKEFRQMTGYLDVLEKIRLISKRFSINPLLPEGFSEDDLDDVEELWALMHGESHERPHDRVDVDFKIESMDSGVKEMIEKCDEPFCVSATSLKYILLGQHFEIQNATIQFQDWKQVEVKPSKMQNKPHEYSVRIVGARARMKLE